MSNSYSKSTRRRTNGLRLLTFKTHCERKLNDGPNPKFLVIDALDECRDDDGSRTELLKTLRSLPTHAKWLIASRNMRSIELDMQGSKRLDICADDEDVRRYVKQRILQERRLNSNVKQKPGLEDTIVSTVMSKVKGMFVISFHPIYYHILTWIKGSCSQNYRWTC